MGDSQIGRGVLAVLMLAGVVGCGAHRPAEAHVNLLAGNTRIELNCSAAHAEGEPDGCAYFTAPDLFNVQLFAPGVQGAPGVLAAALTVRVAQDEVVTYRGEGGVMVEDGPYSCTAYGRAVWVARNPDWRVDVEMSCEDGLSVAGSFWGVMW